MVNSKSEALGYSIPHAIGSIHGDRIIATGIRGWNSSKVACGGIERDSVRQLAGGGKSWLGVTSSDECEGPFAPSGESGVIQIGKGWCLVDGKSEVLACR